MKLKKQIIIVSVAIIIVIAALVFLIETFIISEPLLNNPKEIISDNQIMIGGSRDKYGCLGPAGYTYDTEIFACTKSWELDSNQKRAAKIAVEHIKPTYSLTIININSNNCEGCFTVKLTDQNFNDKLVGIIGWEFAWNSGIEEE